MSLSWTVGLVFSPDTVKVDVKDASGAAARNTKEGRQEPVGAR